MVGRDHMLRASGLGGGMVELWRCGAVEWGQLTQPQQICGALADSGCRFHQATFGLISEVASHTIWIFGNYSGYSIYMEYI